MFSTKQYIVMILAYPLHHKDFFYINPTLRQLRESLKFYTGIDVTVRQIRNVLHDLENEGIIEREFHYLHYGQAGNQFQASSYRVINFNRAFYDYFSLIESSKVVLAREKRRVKIREARKRGLVER